MSISLLVRSKKIGARYTKTRCLVLTCEAFFHSFSSFNWRTRCFLSLTRSLPLICLEGTKDATYNLTALFIISLTFHNPNRSRSKRIHFLYQRIAWASKDEKTIINVSNFNAILFPFICRQTAMCCVPHEFILNMIFLTKAQGTFFFSGNYWSKLSDNLIA